MIHHERLRPPSHDYPADEWNIIEKGFHPEFLAQLETMLALGNGYLGMRGCPEAASSRHAVDPRGKNVARADRVGTQLHALIRVAAG
jgi:trehalose/maltose hydrolase-like predicted phosphorylase